MIRGLKLAAELLNLDVKDHSEEPMQTPDELLKQVPMMYRAQVSGRCSLQFAGENADLEAWTQEWVNPKKTGQPKYQLQQPSQVKDQARYQITVKFPFRLFSNCGQDSIHRPIIGKNGIPILPGTSVKGLFRRACNQAQQKKYCGSIDKPASLRFHAAYPIGDWAGTCKVTYRKKGQTLTETRYRMVDVVHPQQPRQVEGRGSPAAYAAISLFEPLMIFEFSAIKPDLVDWAEVESILKKALLSGAGGKTSTGYGMNASISGQPSPPPNFPLQVQLHGIGVSPLLRNNEPEFRPNLFKATLRGHVSRLLAGTSNREEDIKHKVEYLFGHTGAPGCLQLQWQTAASPTYNLNGSNPTYEIQGSIHLNAEKADLDFVHQVLIFAYLMGGFGKSWRRVWHKQFYPEYTRLAIGCHWTSPQLGKIVTSPSELKAFLSQLHQHCSRYLGSRAAGHLNWKETWNPQCLAVYSKVTDKSCAIELFHHPDFKTTPAIGGRNPGDKRPKNCSSVWHRMLPIGQSSAGKEQFLEIITLFPGDRRSHQDWVRNGQDQLPAFLSSLNQQGFNLTWGNLPDLASFRQPNRR